MTAIAAIDRARQQVRAPEPAHPTPARAKAYRYQPSGSSKPDAPSSSSSPTASSTCRSNTARYAPIARRDPGDHARCSASRITSVLTWRVTSCASSAQNGGVPVSCLDRGVVVAEHEVRPCDARDPRRIDCDGPLVRRHRRVEQPRVPARRDQTGQHARVERAGRPRAGAAAPCSPARDQARHRHRRRDRAPSTSQGRARTRGETRPPPAAASPMPARPPHFAITRRARPSAAHAGA